MAALINGLSVSGEASNSKASQIFSFIFLLTSKASNIFFSRSLILSPQLSTWASLQANWKWRVYDSFSVEPIIWVRRGHESESGQMVLKKVKLTYFDAYLWQTMWNHAKKSMEESKLSDLVFLQWDVRSSVLKTPKNTKTRETKTQITQTLKRYDLSRVVPCERARPEHSENVVVFEVSMF